MRHTNESFTKIFLEGKPYWINGDASWVHPVVSGGDGEDDGGDGDKKPETLNITQAQLDEIIKTRVAKAKDSSVKELLKELGIEDKEQVKAVLSAAKEAEEKNKSELDKALGKSAEFEGKYTGTKKELDEFKLHVAIRDELVEQGLTPAQAKISARLVDVTENDEAKIKASVEELKKTMPQLFQASGKPPVQGGNPGTPPPGGSGDGNDPDAIAKRVLYERHPELANKK
jgi:hypothetical protein